MKSPREIGVGLLVAGASSLLLLAGVEALLRAFDASYRAPVELVPSDAGDVRLHVAATTPGLEYELARGVTVEASPGIVVRTNSWGMRGPEVTAEKPPGVWRVAAVGDSFTFGQGVADEACYPAQLQVLLDGWAGPARTEVLNFGVCGYSTLDEAAQVEACVLEFSPDVIVVLYTFNDPEAHPEHPLHGAFHPRGWFERLQLVRLWSELRWERSLADAGGYYRLMHDPDGPYWPTAVEGLARIGAAARGAGIPVVLAIAPAFAGTTWLTYDLQDVHARVASQARAEGLLVLDLLEPVQAYGYTVKELRLPTDGHANELGNGLIAGEIGAALRELRPDLLGPR